MAQIYCSPHVPVQSGVVPVGGHQLGVLVFQIDQLCKQVGLPGNGTIGFISKIP
jgi:hypothetical protein